MQVADLLTPERIAVPMQVGGLAAALRALVGRLDASGALTRGDPTELADALLESGAGELIRVNPEVLLVTAKTDAVEDLSIALGTSSKPFPVAAFEGGDQSGTARALVLLLTPRRLSTLRVQVIPSLLRLFRSGERTERLLAAESPAQVRAFKELMELQLHERLLVEDAVTPLTYRIYPDTPVTEVLDLMVRRGLDTLPVVGEKYEVLGMITSAEALKHLLPRRMVGETGEAVSRDEHPLVARDIMSRSVMCVSENQSLMEAANLMVNKDVGQLPVVREGELIGFLNRDDILRILFGQ